MVIPTETIIFQIFCSIIFFVHIVSIFSIIYPNMEHIIEPIPPITKPTTHIANRRTGVSNNSLIYSHNVSIVYDNS